MCLGAEATSDIYCIGLIPLMLARNGVDSISRDSPTEDFFAPLCLHLSTRAQSLTGIVWSGVQCMDDEPLFEDEWIGNFIDCLSRLSPLFVALARAISPSSLPS